MSQFRSRPVSWSPVDLINRAARRAVLGQLKGLTHGQLTLRDGAGDLVFGQPANLRVGVRVHEPAFYRYAVTGGTLAIAESYLRGEWDCDDLTALLRIFVRDRATTDRMERGIAKRLVNATRRLLQLGRANTRAGSRRNISAHYDLSNEFFQLWLDDTMAYSSGVFPTLGASMQEASLEKFDRICRKLDLQPDDELLEIGGGWGGFAIHAASHYRCRVTTTTISRRQFDYARQRIDSAGLSDRVTLVNRDYRDLTGQYDKLASIEMIEAVGHRRLDAYFRQCSRLLRSDGSMVLQAIVMPEQGYQKYLKTVDFIQRYVFPGGCLPSMGSMLASVGRCSDLRLVHAEDFAPHYAETLRRWRDAFQQRGDEVRSLAVSEEFMRLWEFYLCSCEAMFEERSIGVVQIQLDKPLCRRDQADLSRLTESMLPRQAAWRSAHNACRETIGT